MAGRCLFLVPVLQVALCSAFFTKNQCGKQYGCWSFPKSCETSDCEAVIRWKYSGRRLAFDMQSVASQNPMMDNTQWMAVGFSTDAAMGNDTVLECVFDTQGIGASYISHNEPGYSNIQLLDATKKLIKKSTAALKDGKMMCHVEVDFSSLAKVNKAERTLVQDIKEGKWTLLFAKGIGSADTGEKYGHALSLATDKKVDLCAKCAGRFAVVESDTQQAQ